MKTARPNVLVVDDDDRVLDTATLLLGSLGYEAITAQSGDQAFAILEAHPAIEVLLTDIVLPGNVGGSDLARVAKEANPGIAIVYTTRYSPMLLLDSEAPCDGLLVRKSWDRDELRATLSDALDKVALAR
jgi:CheY-like chemotaxis protein